MNNKAFVFIKPAANNPNVQKVVSEKFASKGIRIVSEGEYTGKQIDEGRYIDQHYYAIASKATLKQPKDIPVPNAKFEDAFGLSWEDALKSGDVYNAIGACEVLGVDAAGLDALWGSCKKVKLGGGFYCGYIEAEGKKPIYTFNAFFMQMRSSFVKESVSIHYYVVEFSPKDLSWAEFRGNVLGPTDPKTAPADSLRGSILASWESLGLEYEPNVGENCVHASASPFEGLAERMNWLKVPVEEDSFGAALVEAGMSVDKIKEWSVDPPVNGKSIFDQLEDMDADDCMSIMIGLASD